MISALAEGQSELRGFLDAADPHSTIACLRGLGVEVSQSAGVVTVTGRGLYGLRAPVQVLDAGNSGTTIRLLSGILAGQTFLSTIAGDESLNRRPMKRIIDPLSQMGATITSSRDLTAPLEIHGRYPLKPISFVPRKPSAQVKSAVLFAGLFAEGKTEVVERTVTRDHTERMLGLAPSTSEEGAKVVVEGGRQILGQSYEVPGDISSAAFIIAAASIVRGSQVTLKNIGLNPTRSRILSFFRSIGASIQESNLRTVAGEPIGDLFVKSADLWGSVMLKGSDVAELIDEIPIIATTCAVSGIDLSVRGGSDLRNKESDRIHAIVENLRRMKLEVEEYEDGFSFEGKRVMTPARCDSKLDHRIAMAFAVCGLALEGTTTIGNAECVDISFPTFWKIIDQLQRNEP